MLWECTNYSCCIRWIVIAIVHGGVQLVNTHWCWKKVVQLPIIFGWCKQLQMCFDLVAHKSTQFFDSCCVDNTNP
jgi:hypothetical protein